MVNAIHSMGYQNTLRFGLMTKTQEAKVAEKLPLVPRLLELINQYEENQKVPLGFVPQKEQAAREAEGKALEKSLLKFVQRKDFTPELAHNFLMELYQKRDDLVHQLPDEIFDAILAKANRFNETTEEADEVPEAVKKRAGTQIAQIPPELLKALLLRQKQAELT